MWAISPKVEDVVSTFT